jgi:hypothetical protein
MKILTTQSTLVTLTLVAMSVHGQAPTAGSLQGSVTDENGTPIVNASVHYSRIAQLTAQGTASKRFYVFDPSDPQYTGTALTTSTGQYSALGMPSGNYYVCASVAFSAYLDGCLWQPVIQAVVPAGQSSASVSIRLKKGAVLRITVNDPLQLLRASTDPARGSNLIVGVQGQDGSIYVAPLASATATQWQLQITVPTTSQLNLWLFSTQLQIGDAARTQLDTRGPTSGISIPAGPADKSLQLQVLGPAATAN